MAKPIPSYQVYKGTVFELVDHAVDFVLSKIDLSVGTRAKGPRAPVSYEIPKEVVSEAIVNAIAHRDYTSTASVQVMLFSDRLEVRNPGRLPSELSVAQLFKAHASWPNNPLLARSLYLAEYIEQMGTGTLDMARRCAEAGLLKPKVALTSDFVITIWRPQKSREVEGGDGVPAGSQNQGAESGGRVKGQSQRAESGARVESQSQRPESKGRSREPSQRSKPRSRVGGQSQRPESKGRVRGQSQRAESRGRVKGQSQGAESGGRVKGPSQRGDSKQKSSRISGVSRTLLKLLIHEEMSKSELAKFLGYKKVSGYLNRVVRRLLESGHIAYTLPDKPQSRLQKYYLTSKGRKALDRGDI